MSSVTVHTDEVAQQRRDDVQDRLAIDNPNAVPAIEKIVLNVGMGDARNNVTRLEQVQDQLTRITGQEPVVTRAKKSVASYGIRQGDPVGVKVTLRGDVMHHFLQKLIHISLPRSRDFSGLDPSIHEDGIYAAHISPGEIGNSPEEIMSEFEEGEETTRFGMDCVIVTTANDIESGRVLLEEYGLPFASA